MANKECLIVVLDVRSSADEQFKLKSVKCAAEIIKDKIVSNKKDYVSFVLVGSESTNNTLNTEDPLFYENIVQFPQTQLCTWQLLLSLFKFVNEPPCDEGEWLDALEVAMSVLKEAEIFKCRRQRILLFYDFNYKTQNYDIFNKVTRKLVEKGIELIVGTHNIAYVDNIKANQAEAIFLNSQKVDSTEQANQEYALKLVTDCNAVLCNFKEVLSSVFKVENTRPWTWSAPLYIGTHISMKVQGFIAMKNESNIKLKKVWAEEDEEVRRQQQLTISGIEISPEPDDIVDGYMLGGTAVPYDDELMKPTRHKQGLHFVGFCLRKEIPDEHYCGESIYTLVHQKGNETSARKLDALVRALHRQERVMLCWKIYSEKWNKPHLVVLLPDELSENRPATLSMLELANHAQHVFWDFPALCTEKTKCSIEQMDAVDKLIDSMDLEFTLNDPQQPRVYQQNDLLSFTKLPNVFEQNVMDVLERKVLNLVTDDDQFAEMLQDKNFVEVFWTVPEAIEEKSKQAAKELKKMFPLEKSKAWLEKLKTKEPDCKAPLIKKEAPQEANDSLSSQSLDVVGLMTPVEDFKQLLEKNVRPLQNNTQRDAKFLTYAAQMRVVIFTLLERPKLNVKLLCEILLLYRNSCLEFNTYAEYDSFAADLRQRAVAKDLREFWQNVMVAQQLGPLVLGEATLNDKDRLEAFYTIDEWKETLDDLFSQGTSKNV